MSRSAWLNGSALVQGIGHIAALLRTGDFWERIISLSLVAIVPFLAFYNLATNPRPWHDEGAALSVAKTLAEDGVYAVRSTDGYQTFGPVQSVGPTVLLPIALSYKLFGVGVVQGRIVAAAYLLFALGLFYGVAQELFGRRAALLAVLLLLGSPSARILHFGRQALGEVAALGFFLAMWWVWLRGQRLGTYGRPVAMGLLLGAAMVTKSSYMALGFGMLVIVIALDLLYYRQKNLRPLVVAGAVAGACVAAWWGWQALYFGMDVFRENAAKLSQLGASTSGFNVQILLAGLEFLIDSDQGYFYFLWGFPALVYAGAWSLRRDQRSVALVALLMLALLWLGYYLLSVPWLSYLFVPAAITALFVGKLCHALMERLRFSWHGLRHEIAQGQPASNALSLVALFGLALMIAVPLLAAVRVHVLAKDAGPQQAAAYLNAQVADTAIIETWERELAVMTHHQYHAPDQSLLIETHAALYRNGPRDYSLGLDYFAAYRPDYLVVGWFARWLEVYSPAFIEQYAVLRATIGEGTERYDIYELRLP